MSSSRRRQPLSPSAAQLDDDDLLSKILLRLPPQPSSLPRASLVCKRWRQLVSDPQFRRRFRIRHRRNPPLVGLLDRFELSFIPTLDAPNRVPPERFSFQRDIDGGRFVPLGCRHGLVLIYLPTGMHILVWDPATGDQHRLAVPPVVAACLGNTPVNGAVLRDAGDAQHFQVVLVVAYGDDERHMRALACVYSSKTGLWGDPISTPLPYEAVQAGETSFPTLVSTDDAVLAGSSLYWLLVGDFKGILEFDLEKQSLAVIRLPVVNCIKLMRAEGGGLGLLRMSGLYCAQLWKRMTDCDPAASWVLGKTIELDKVLSLKPEEKDTIIIQGLAEQNNVLVLWTSGGLFMVHLDSLKFKKLFKTMIISQYHPFESVYTAGLQKDASDAEDLKKDAEMLRANAMQMMRICGTVLDNK